MNGSKFPWNFVPEDRAHKDHERKPNPQPEPELHRTDPASDPKKHDEVRENTSDDEGPNNLDGHSRWLRFRRVDRGARLFPEQLDSGLAEDDVPHRTGRDCGDRGYNNGQIVYPEHKSYASFSKPVEQLKCQALRPVG